jgi:hypothetical protein
LQISDHTTSTTCTIFDDEANRLLKITVSELLNLVQGNNDEVPKVIQELMGKIFIFRFKLNERNLAKEGKGIWSQGHIFLMICSRKNSLMIKIKR